MLEGISIYISILFIATILATVAWLYYATRSKIFLIIAAAWIGLQSFLGFSGFYLDPFAIPPKLMFGGIPILVFILVLFVTERGRRFIDSINLKTLTYLHIIRIPVEFVLILLAYEGFISKFMTFEGTNFDLFSGVSAPYYSVFCF